MSDSLPIIFLARHGDTPWTITGQHTGLTDLPLTERGERNARRLGERLTGLAFAKVFSSKCHGTARSPPWVKERMPPGYSNDKTDDSTKERGQCEPRR